MGREGKSLRKGLVTYEEERKVREEGRVVKAGGNLGSSE